MLTADFFEIKKRPTVELLIALHVIKYGNPFSFFQRFQAKKQIAYLASLLKRL